MCTVIVEVPQRVDAATRVLAVRDEDPDRAWDPPGQWWPERYPGVVGVRDRLAGGAWLAADPRAGRLAVILNRPEWIESAPETPLGSRGAIPLDSVWGRPVTDPPHTQSFNLVEVHAGSTRVSAWNGERLAPQQLSPGVHMLAHHAVDDPGTARIQHWLPEFRALAGLPDAGWRDAWVAVLARSAELQADDDRAIIRDNRSHGFPTQTLLACTAEIRPGAVDLEVIVSGDAAEGERLRLLRRADR